MEHKKKLNGFIKMDIDKNQFLQLEFADECFHFRVFELISISEKAINARRKIDNRETKNTKSTIW